jgi:integrase
LDPVAARDAARAEQRALEAARKANEEAEKRRVTFEKLAEAFLSAATGGRHRTYSQIFDLDLRKPLGRKLACEVMRSDLQRVIDAVVARGAHVQARRVYEVARAMLRWGITRDYLAGEPWRGVELPAKREGRDRVLTAAELRWLWRTTETRWADEPHIARILRLQVLLGQRSGEIAGLERDEISADSMTWKLPGRRTKNGKAHTVPLPPMAREIIGEALAAATDSRHVFTGGRGKVARSDTVAHEIAGAIAAHNAAAADGEQVEPFTPHDIRRTMATGLEAMGVRNNVIGTALNHISAKKASVTSAHYTHADLSMEVRAALTRWQATVEAVLAGEDPFATRAEDIVELERRMLLRSYGGPAKLRVLK